MIEDFTIKLNKSDTVLRPATDELFHVDESQRLENPGLKDFVPLLQTHYLLVKEVDRMFKLQLQSYVQE